jgi:predicted RNA binding protein YcfA (HicA-like mRNA interferase family)
VSKLPRDLAGRELARRLRQFGYEIVGWRGSHMNCVTLNHGEHRVVIPDHHPLKVGMLHGMLAAVAEHFEMSVTELRRLLDL